MYINIKYAYTICTYIINNNILSLYTYIMYIVSSYNMYNILCIMIS